VNQSLNHRKLWLAVMCKYKSQFDLNSDLMQFGDDSMLHPVS